MTTTKPCVFCAIAAGTEPAEIVRKWPDAVAFLPHGGITAGGGHILVIPRGHVATALEDPTVTGTVGTRGAELAIELGWTEANFIDNIGPYASQTVFHYHKHLVRRRPGDGIALPWPQPLQESA